MLHHTLIKCNTIQFYTFCIEDGDTDNDSVIDVDSMDMSTDSSKSFAYWCVNQAMQSPPALPRTHLTLFQSHGIALLSCLSIQSRVPRICLSQYLHLLYRWWRSRYRQRSVRVFYHKGAYQRPQASSHSFCFTTHK